MDFGSDMKSYGQKLSDKNKRLHTGLSNENMSNTKYLHAFPELSGSILRSQSSTA